MASNFGYITKYDDGTKTLNWNFQLSTNVVGEQYYLVKEEETLFSIAAKLYGDTNYWSDIAIMNPTIDPLVLEIGTQLTIPTYG